MVLIPPDIGLRLRQQTEILPQPITPLREIPADLPGLKTGQVFSALIQEALPENTYRALVAGKSVTLSLPEAVKSGDVLDLVVVDRTPKTIVAQLAGTRAGALAGEAAGQAVYPHATFSRAAQLISSLLVADGDTPPSAELNRGQPLLAQPPRSGAELLPALNKAVTESGLFYEAHQAQWVAGKLPLANLLQEPQGQHSLPQAQFAAQASGQAGSTEAPEEAQQKDAATPFQANRPAAGREEGTEGTRTQASSNAALSQTIASMPEEMRPLVQQQLDAAGMQRLLWHGEVWPGQTMDWKVEWEGDKNSERYSNQNESQVWATQLRLTTPRLGELEATVRLGQSGVQIILTAAEEDSALTLRNGIPKLEQALSAAGVPLLGMTVTQAQEE